MADATQSTAMSTTIIQTIQATTGWWVLPTTEDESKQFRYCFTYALKWNFDKFRSTCRDLRLARTQNSKVIIAADQWISMMNGTACQFQRVQTVCPISNKKEGSTLYVDL